MTTYSDDPVELLTRIIHGGERVFEPEGDSIDDLGAFQLIVEAICRLGDDSHIEIKEPERDETSRLRYYKRVEVVTVRPSARKMLERAERMGGLIPEPESEVESAAAEVPEADPVVAAAQPVPRVGVGAVVIHEGRVLMVKRAQPPRVGVWSVPGGKVAFGETLQEAAEREVREETGISISAGSPVHTFELLEEEGGQLCWHYVIVDLQGEYLGGEVQSGSDAQEAAWMTPGELAALKLDSETRRLLRRQPGFDF